MPASEGLQLFILSAHPFSEIAPHPSPLPEGEGTDRGGCGRYAGLKYRVELEFENQKPLTLALSQREREQIAVDVKGTPA